MASVFDGARRERLLAAMLAGILVLLRCAVPTIYEGFFFDSDQAIVGLMARHVSLSPPGHDFPLYYYGLNYLLGVQAWLIAPFFVLLRPTVAAMRAPLVLLNVAVAIALVEILSRRLKLRPALALVAALPFVIPGPAAAAHLVEAAGASIEPFVYVIALWCLRRRPVLFGLVLGLGVLHREFVLFAVPALLLVEALIEARTGDLSKMGAIRWIGSAAAGAALVWLVVDDARMHLAGQSLGSQATSLRGQLCFDGGFTDRVAATVEQAVPTLFGGRPIPLQAMRIDSPLAFGHGVLGWLTAATLLLIVARLIAVAGRARGSEERRAIGLPIYLALVGVFAVCAYPLSCNVALGAPPVLRYLLLGLLIPVGLFAAHAVVETSPRVRALTVAAFAVWAVVNLTDTTRLIVGTARTPPLNEHRVLTDYLQSRGVKYASANYWDAYVVSFLSRERVIVASNDVVRIEQHQREVAAHAADAVNLARQPCAGFATVASWCLQR